MPNVVPQTERRTITMGMMRMSRSLNLPMTWLRPAFMAFVFVMIANDPPMRRTNATTSAAAWMPWVGASSSCITLQRRSTFSPVSESV